MSVPRLQSSGVCIKFSVILITLSCHCEANSQLISNVSSLCIYSFCTPFACDVLTAFNQNFDTILMFCSTFNITTALTCKVYFINKFVYLNDRKFMVRAVAAIKVHISKDSSNFQVYTFFESNLIYMDCSYHNSKVSTILFCMLSTHLV